MPACILLFAGKRKSGKDYVTDRLQEALGADRSVIVRLSGPLKKCYAETHGLDYDLLLSADGYKEKYRKDMIAWSEEIRDRDHGYFCRAAIDFYAAAKDKKSVWIVSDCRRKTDLEFFRSEYGGSSSTKVLLAKVFASEETRVSRGFDFQPGVDDAESECGLDDVTDWNFVIENNGNRTGEELIKPILDVINA